VSAQEVDMPRIIGLIALLVLASCSVPGAPPASFNIFFTANSAVLTPEASAAVDQAAAAIKQTHPSTVAIAAGAGAGNNLRLAQPRYAAVRQALEAKGVSPTLIAQASLPASGAAVNETGNQRVEIILGQ
jgi:outer membrane protein OmpA-like peptidoglycan-associated protein